MKKEKKKKQKQVLKSLTKCEKGITLIALVVTIVVLLILAGITITFVLGEGGILDMAKEAAKRTNEAKEQELKDFADFQNQVENWVNGGKTDSGENQQEESIDKLKFGEYVNYTKNDKNILCQVLYDKQYNDEKGTNYGIQLVTVDNICTVELLGKDRTNYINVLNAKAEEYRNDDLSDIGGARCIGTLPSDPTNSNEAYFTGYDVTLYTWPDKLNCDEDMEQYFKLETEEEEDFWIGAMFNHTEEADTTYNVGGVLVYSWAKSWYSNKGGEYPVEGIWDDFGSTVGGVDDVYSKVSKGFKSVFKLKPTLKFGHGTGSVDDPFELVW